MLKIRRMAGGMKSGVGREEEKIKIINKNGADNRRLKNCF